MEWEAEIIGQNMIWGSRDFSISVIFNSYYYWGLTYNTESLAEKIHRGKSYLVFVSSTLHFLCMVATVGQNIEAAEHRENCKGFAICVFPLLL